MNNTSLYYLENQRTELLKKNGLDTESINQFKSKIKIVSEEIKENLGKKLFELISNKGFNDDYEKVIELIYNGANVEFKNEKKGDFALLICARKNYIKTFIVLLKAGADVNQVNNYLTTSAMASAIHGNKEILEMLILMGANINARCLDGDNAIMSAKRHDQVECFNLLVNSNAYLNNSNLMNQNLLDIESKETFDSIQMASSLKDKISDYVTEDDTLALIEEAINEMKRVNNVSLQSNDKLKIENQGQKRRVFSKIN